MLGKPLEKECQIAETSGDLGFFSVGVDLL